MKNIFQLAMLTLSIIAMFGMSMNVYADQPNDRPQACNNEQAKHVGNKHCDNTGSGSFSICDTDDSGSIDYEELSAHTGDSDVKSQTTIMNAENASGSQQGPISGEIDSSRELRELNEYISDPC